MSVAFSNLERPLAITMWEQSWLQRRWPGAGFEDWDRALAELVERGYDAVRLDANPHNLVVDKDATWHFTPVSDNSDWASPLPIDVRFWPELPDFIRACRDHGVKVGLSSWFEADDTHAELRLRTPELHAAAWARTLDLLDAEGVTDALLYVDLCNEWPHELWAPFYEPAPGEKRHWASPSSIEWMKKAIDLLRPASRGLPLTFSILPEKTWDDADLSFMDFLEPHIWMAQSSDYYERIGYEYPKFGFDGYRLLQREAEKLYRSDPEYWKADLRRIVEETAEVSRRINRPLMTTECWALVDWRDFPQLDWGFIKELCEVGVRAASATGRWMAIATSNFCEPQFKGMWRDVEWHQQMTDVIHNAGLPR